MNRLLPVVTCCFALAACASSPPPAAVSREAPFSNMPPPVERKLPTEYILMDAASSQRPAWIDREPDDEEGAHFLVGMSAHHASERDAREEAMRHARKKFADYTGVDVSHIDEVVRSLYGSASGILDATVAGAARSREETDAHVSRIKAWKWYGEKYRVVKGGIDQGVAYSSWVLVTVPAGEVGRVHEWKAKKAEEERVRQVTAREKAEQELLQILDENSRRSAAIDRTLLEGEVVRAFSLLQTEYQRLDLAADDLAGRGAPFADKAGEVRRVQRGLLARAGEIAASLHLDVGRIAPVYSFLAQNSERQVTVWAWLRTEGVYRPAQRLPLALRSAAGVLLARATTDPSGRVDFPLAAVPAGELRVTIDVESAAFSGLSQPLLANIGKFEGQLAVTALQPNLEGAVRGMIGRLFAGPALEPPPVGKVIVGSVTYGESGQGSEFAFVLKRVLAEHLTQVPGLAVVAPRTRGVDVVASAAASAILTRGIAANQKPVLGAGATQAVIDGADAALETIYAVRGGEVILDLALKEAGSDILLAAASAAVRRENLPAGIELMPASSFPPSAQPVSAMSSAAGAGAGPIRLEVTSHLGDGQTYADGETISYFVRLDRDAYLLLVYEDAAGHLIRILPNRYSGSNFYRAGSTLQIPGPRDPFEFTITAPFGMERVWAFASSFPFPAFAGAELENGLLLLEGGLEGVISRIRFTGRQPGGAYGEAQAMITTVSSKAGWAAFR